MQLPPIRSWPEPKAGKRYGLSEPSVKETHGSMFLYHMKPQDRPHNHELDIVLEHGGAGSGKTAASIAEVTELVAGFPGAKAVVGGKNYPLLKRNVVSEFARRFALGSDHDDWSHPLVKRRPTVNDMMMRTIFGSTLQFLNLDKYLVARGFDADVVLIEEVNLMEAQSFDEMIRRSRGKTLPIRQFILTMNPTGDRDWIFYKFNMKQFEPSYKASKGPPLPIGEPCKCQYCTSCIDRSIGEFVWEGGEKKYADYTYKDMYGQEQTIKDRCYEWKDGVCPNCGVHKNTSCPGNQHYYRVIMSKSWQNPHNPDSYVQDMKGNMDPESYLMFVEGEVIQVRKGKVYKAFSNANISDFPVELNPDKDLIWTHDFNRDPMCSVLWQEYEQGIQVIDEIVVWDANEQKVAAAFVKRFEGFKGRILIYGDPAGLYGSGRAESRRTSYQILYDYLKLYKFNAEIHMQKIEGETKIAIKDRINNANAMLRNAEGQVRVKINPHCGHLINSLASINWDEAGKEEDKKVDEDAKLIPDREKNPPIMTHPSCAFGYAVYKRFPIIQRKKSFGVFITEEGSMIQQQDGKVKTEKGISRSEALERYVQGTLPTPAKVPEDTSTGFAKILDDKGYSFTNDVLKERLEHERKEKEAYEAALRKKLEKYFIKSE